MEAKTKKIIWIVIAVIVGISVIGPVIPWIALYALESSEKSNNQEIEQFISNRDYDKARQIANKLDSRDKEETLTKINKAQLSVMVVEFSLKDAEYMAQELNAMPEFFEVLGNNIQSVYSKDFRGLYNLLSRYPITATYHALLPHVGDYEIKKAYEYAGGGSSIGEDYYYSTNVGYNTEIGRLNKLVSQVLDLAVFDENKDYIRKLLPLFKPEAVETKRVKQNDYQGGYNISYKLENNAKADALRKIKEAGINL